MLCLFSGVTMRRPGIQGLRTHRAICIISRRRPRQSTRGKTQRLALDIPQIVFESGGKQLQVIAAFVLLRCLSWLLCCTLLISFVMRPAGLRARGNSVARRGAEAAEIAILEAAIAGGAPAPGEDVLKNCRAGGAVRAAAAVTGSFPPLSAARTFDQLPLSRATRDALRAAGFTQLTAVQRATLPHTLVGRDILGAAKTGSGKTLAFLIPTIELLFRARWSPADGLGGLVLTPTRELALQIFDTLRSVARGHTLSAGLLIGGKDVAYEKQKVCSMNLLVATPGRMLQHCDETPYFDCGSLRVLVLDEADRCLDMGFAACVDAILAFLPPVRQTLLFSATQTQKVADLARLSLRSPERVAVHEHAAAPTPHRLVQMVATVAAGDKMQALWGFIKSHLSCKTLVFVSSCRQVSFLAEALRQLRPGVPLRALHGRMKQSRRLAAFADFGAARCAVLLATDVASRGLDFPSVDWVLQLDCPEDAAAYIHRVGRTARYTHAGKALLLLDPGEGAFADRLAAARVPVTRTHCALGRVPPVAPALQGLLSQDAQLKTHAQRACVSYLRALHVAHDKEVFSVDRVDAAAYARSLGLDNPPKLRFVARGSRVVHHEADGGEEGDDGVGGSGGSGDDALLSVKRANHALPGDDSSAPTDTAAVACVASPAGETGGCDAAHPKRLRIRAGGVAAGSRATKHVFDASGAARRPLEALAEATGEGGATHHGGADSLRAAVAERYTAAAAMREAGDGADKARERALRRERKLKARRRADHAHPRHFGSTSGDDSHGSDDANEAGARLADLEVLALRVLG